MKDKIQKYIDIAVYTEHMDIAEKLRNMVDMLESGKYLLAFMGEYSAGKSRLINNLLGRDILPTHVNETTALITYIQYGDSEYAELVELDGSVSECSFDDIVEIWQSGVAAEKISHLDCIRLFVNSDILRNGMIIADTPGINTVFQPHVEKTVNLLESANRVVYVMGGSMNGVDRDFVNCIHDNGIETIMVRSKMDMLSSTDENIDDTIRKENSELSIFTSAPVFFVSNEKDTRFYPAVSELRSYLLNNVSASLKENLEKAAEAKLSVYTGTLEKLLKEKEKMINMLLSNNTSAYNEEKKKSERKLRQLNDTLSDNQKKLRADFESVRSAAMRDALKVKDKKLEKDTRWIGEQNFSLEGFSFSSFGEELEKCLKRDCCDIQNAYISAFDKVTGNNVRELRDELAANDLFFDTVPPATLDEAEDIMEEYQQRVAALNALQDSLQNKIEECRVQISNKEDQLSGAAQQLKVYEDAVNEVQGELNALGRYVPRYVIQEGSHSKEKQMAAAGKALDILSILIPGEAWAKGLGLVLKGVKGAEVSVNTLKGIDLAMDGVRMLHKFKKDAMNPSDVTAIGMNDPYVEAAYVGEEGRRQLENQLRNNEQPPNILDFLSIEYYFKKLGKKMDKPDVVVEDQAYKISYENARDAIKNEASAKANAAAEERIRIMHIKDEAEKAKVRQDALDREMKNADALIDEEEKKYKKELKKRININYCKYYTGLVDDSLTEFTESLKSEVLPKIEAKMTAYLDSYGLSLREEIESQNDTLNDLESKFNGEGKEALEKELEKCHEMLGRIGSEGRQVCTV